MSQTLLRLTGLIVLLCALTVGGSIVIGRMMPSVPIAVFMTDTMQADLLIVRVDTLLKTRAIERLKLAHPPVWIDLDCRVFLLAVAGETIQLVYLDLHNRQQHVYLPSPDFNRTSLANRLPDKQRTWVQYMDNAGVLHSMLMDMATGATTPVELPQYKALQSTRWVWAPDGEHGLLLMQGIDVAYGYLLTTDTGTLVEVAATTRQISQWSPDGRYLATMSLAQKTVSVLDVQPTTLVKREARFNDVSNAIGLAWTADNRLLFVARSSAQNDYQGYQWLPDAESPDVTPLMMPASYFASRSAAGVWSPDTTRLAYSSGGQTRIYDTASGKEFMNLDIPVSGGLWSPDSRYLIDHDRTGGKLIVIDTREHRVTIFALGLYYLAERWSPDGSELTLFDTATSTLGRMFLGSGTPELRMDFQYNDANNAAFCYPETAS